MLAVVYVCAPTTQVPPSQGTEMHHYLTAKGEGGKPFIQTATHDVMDVCRVNDGMAVLRAVCLSVCLSVCVCVRCAFKTPVLPKKRSVTPPRVCVRVCVCVCVCVRLCVWIRSAHPIAQPECESDYFINTALWFHAHTQKQP